MRERLVAAASMLTLMIACLDLVGWAVGSLALVRIVPWHGAGIMMPNTALGLLLGGAGLRVLRQKGAALPRRRWLGLALASGCLLLGTLTIAEYLFGVGLGIDLLLFGKTVQAQVTQLPGRPSPMTATGFCLTGLALLALGIQARWAQRLTRALALCLMFLSAASLVAYLYQDETLLTLGPLLKATSPFTPMGLHTAAAFLMLSLGLLFARRELGMLEVLWRDDAGGFMARRLLLTAIPIPLVVIKLRLLGEELGLYSTTFGSSVFGLVAMTLLTSVILRNARQLSRLDASRRQAEAALRLSEARLSGIISNAADAVISIDSEHRITLFNEGAERIFGYPASEALGQPLSLLLPERLRRNHTEHIRGFSAGPSSTRRMGEHQPIIGLRRNGEEFAAEATISKLEVQGRTLVTVILRDITERQRAQETLEASELRFRTAFEDAPIGMALVSVEGAFLNVNASLCKLVGYPARELLALKSQDITFPEDLEADLAKVRAMLEGGLGSYQIEKRYVHREGHLVTALLTASLVRDPQGRPRYFISQIQDISARKELERTSSVLAEAGLRLAGTLDLSATLKSVVRLMVPALADGSMVGLIDENEQMRWLEGTAVAPEHDRLLQELLTTYPQDPSRPGYMLADLLPTSVFSVLEEYPSATFMAAARDECQRELISRLDFGMLLAIPLKTRGRLLGSLLLARARPGRYSAWEKALAENLASRAALAIDNARLYQRSEQAVRVRDEVLRIVAHDLRAPLHVITLSTELLKQHLPEEHAGDRKHLAAIFRAVGRGNQLIQDLLDVAQMEAHRLSVVRKVEETRSIIEEALMLHRALAEAKSIRLESSVPQECPALFADRNRVLQILSNLIGNALKFTPEGGVVSLRVEPAGSLLRFSVSDTGMGIASEELPHLFEPFWQARPGRREGAGLGLAIVKGLVEAHGGELHVESAPGTGSTFSFTLPTEVLAERH